MSEILGSSGTSSPINPIRKKALAENWQIVAAKAVTDDEFKKVLAANPIKILEEHGLTVSPEIKIIFDETNQEYSAIVTTDASEEMKEELKAEAKWWTWRLKMIKEFGQELDRQVGTVAGFDEGCGNELS
jgi:hypothetical protein